MFSAPWDKLPLQEDRSYSKPSKTNHDKTLVEWVADILSERMPVTDCDRDAGTIKVCSETNDNVVHVIKFERIS